MFSNPSLLDLVVSVNAMFGEAIFFTVAAPIPEAAPVISIESIFLILFFILILYLKSTNSILEKY
jgi:hypothetical protein